MPISVTCQCGKSLRVKDDWVGKQAKCPGCGETFVVPASGGPVKPVVNVPGAQMWSSRARPQTKEGVGTKLSLSPMTIVWLIVVIAIPLIIFLVRIGPVRAQREWKGIEPRAQSDITDVITKAIQSEAMFNTADSHHAPGVASVVMDANVILYVPEVVRFTGRGTSGFFSGTYNTQTGEVVADVPRTMGSGQMHVTGRVGDGKIQAEVDGQEARLIYRPKTREEMD